MRPFLFLSTWLCEHGLDHTQSVFSFMAYPLPRLTFEQRRGLEVQNGITKKIKTKKIQMEIDLDEFGKACWIYVSSSEDLYWELKQKCEP